MPLATPPCCPITYLVGPATVDLQGRLPAGFAGTLYRNGPAWKERNGFRYDLNTKTGNSGSAVPPPSIPAVAAE